MKKFLFILVLISCFNSFAQDDDAVVYFKNKLNTATFIANPLTMLTQRALDRRTAQNIALDATDVPITQSYIDQILMQNTVMVLAKSKWLNCIYVRGFQADINLLKTLPFVESVSFLDNSMNLVANQPIIHNTSRPINGLEPVNKVLSTLSTFNYGTSFNQIHMMNGEILHQQNFTGSGKIIAVLDAGFPGVDTAQPFARLLTNNAILGGYDFVNKSTNFYTGNDHGTLVLSCMGGFKDNQLVGTAPDAKYYLFITEDVASENPVEEANWVEAAEEADRLGVDVITTSLGYFGFDNPAYSHSYSDMIGNKNYASKGVNMAFSKGIIVVASAGNEGNSSEPHVGVPGEATKALAIGAVQANRNRAGFSSIGPSFDNRVKPDLMAQGQASIVSSTSGTITNANGTSFSGPILAGMIASFWQAVPTMTNQQVIDLVKQSADKFSTPDNNYGYGIPNFQLALSAALPNENFVFNTNKNFVFAPNPANDKLNISFPNDINKAKISLSNVLGQVVFQDEISTSSAAINVSTFNAGVYFYSIESNDFKQSGKIIKN